MLLTCCYTVHSRPVAFEAHAPSQAARLRCALVHGAHVNNVCRQASEVFRLDDVRKVFIDAITYMEPDPLTRLTRKPILSLSRSLNHEQPQRPLDPQWVFLSFSLSLSLSLHFFRVIEQCAGGWCRYRVVGLSVLWEGREEGDRRDHGER